MKQIPLTQGKFALVDDEWFDYLSQWRWYHCNGYAIRNSSRRIGKRARIWMHRVIMSAPEEMGVDHIDHDGLNNQHNNLRLATSIENGRNQKPRTGGTSTYKGVYLNRGRWRARIVVNYKTISLGYFTNEQEAAKAYDEAARKYHGEFAHANFEEAA